jgi:DNA-directed RNA polymerase subunit RPC12/RpoP
MNEELKPDKQFKCTQCGAMLTYQPGTEFLVCQYCHHQNTIESAPSSIEELDFHSYLNDSANMSDQMEMTTVKCHSCGAAVTLQPLVTADQCPYCAAGLIIQEQITSRMIKPKFLLPFKFDQKQAAEAFRKWVNGLWFAPSNLKKGAAWQKLSGVYVPYWTYDSDTDSAYTGQRGTYYYTTESYTTTENGKSVTKTRQVRHTRWSNVSGAVSHFFDDVLILASTALPVKYTNKLEPWPLQQLLPFNESYLAGFRSEAYQVNLKDGFDQARKIMDTQIRELIRRDIGGDEQRILSVDSRFSNIKFKHILLPVWISSYRYQQKVYRFLVNGQTGEVQGERPYSIGKIIAAIAGVLAAAILIYFIWLK